MIAIKLFFAGLTTICCTTLVAQETGKVTLHVDEKQTYQTIENFAGSDAWACQFVGNWPDAKKNAVADWLFSMDTLSNGNPKGIGLSLWRYNLGAGSAGQLDSSGIKDEWRRAALTTGKTTEETNKVKAQNWFLEAAQKRGVQQFLAFYNSPPIQFTKNGKAFAVKGISNIDKSNYQAFAAYTVAALQTIKKSTNINFNYLSPVNEPQWDWSDGGQEGCPYNNEDISQLAKAFSETFRQKKIATKLLLAESGDLKYLIPATNKQDKDDQVHDFFHPASPNYLGNLPNVSKTIAAHSYFTTSPIADGIALRTKVKDSVAQVKGLGYWQSEYCILGDNAGEIDGSKKDLGMKSALYVAKVMYEDLVAADATAWQWWTAVSAYDYKDGLVYIDKKETDGNISDSKMLWAMGNYSRFIRPGMQRINVTGTSKELLVSGYANAAKNKLVIVVINETEKEQPIAFDNTALSSNNNITVYITDETRNLEKTTVAATNLAVPAKSVVSIVVNTTSTKP